MLVHLSVNALTWAGMSTHIRSRIKYREYIYSLSVCTTPNIRSHIIYTQVFKDVISVRGTMCVRTY